MADTTFESVGASQPDASGLGQLREVSATFSRTPSDGRSWKRHPLERARHRVAGSREASTRKRHDRVSRTIDVAGASVVLVLVAPVLVAVAAAIRVSSRGPVIFRQRRLGMNLEPFDCLKFRTMHRDSARIIAELRRTRPDIDAELENNFKLRDDPRVSRLGRVLRQTSLDELPQLINVLRGEMSLVGPRPIVAEEGTKYGGQLRWVLSVRPGMTGAWQVSGRNRISYPDRVDIDVAYVDRKSVLGDLSILIKTPAALLDWHATS